MVNRAAKGRKLEHYIRQILEDAGFSVVRGAGSKGEFFDEKVDLVATKVSTQGTEYKLLIYGFQCKVHASSK